MPKTKFKAKCYRKGLYIGETNAILEQGVDYCGKFLAFDAGTVLFYRASDSKTYMTNARAWSFDDD